MSKGTKLLSIMLVVLIVVCGFLAWVLTSDSTKMKSYAPIVKNEKPSAKLITSIPKKTNIRDISKRFSRRSRQFSRIARDEQKISAEQQISATTSAFEHRFKRNKNDLGWATAMENRLQVQFKKSIKTKGISLRGVDCKSTMCRIELEYSNAKIGHSIQSNLMHRVVFEEKQCQLTSTGVSPHLINQAKGTIGQVLFLDCSAVVSKSAQRKRY